MSSSAATTWDEAVSTIGTYGGRTTVSSLDLELGESGEPSQALFEQLAQRDPARLLSLIDSGRLPSHLLTYAAEWAGHAVSNPRMAIRCLLGLLRHSSPIVREGAVYGLANFASQGEIRDALMRLAFGESSPGVRAAAFEVLEDARSE